MRIETKTYRSERGADRDQGKRNEKGWRVQSRSTRSERRGIGLLFGLVGYWLLPKRTVVTVTYEHADLAPRPWWWPRALA